MTVDSLVLIAYILWTWKNNDKYCTYAHIFLPSQLSVATFNELLIVFTLTKFHTSLNVSKKPSRLITLQFNVL